MGLPLPDMGDNPVGFLKVIGILFVGAIILAVIPVFGQLQSRQTLILGGLALVSVLGIIESAYPGSVSSRVQLWPGFWFVAGLLVIGAIAAWFGMLVAAGVSAALQNATQGLAQVMIFPLAAVFGFIPLFMYGAWLGAQLRGD